MPNLVWIVVAVCFGLGYALLAPLMFERTVQGADALRAKFNFRFFQYFYPQKRPGEAMMSEYLIARTSNDLGAYSSRRQAIGERSNAIRQLTGSDVGNHVRALSAAGLLISHIAEEKWIKPMDQNCERPLSALDFLGILIPAMKSKALDSVSDIRKSLVDDPVDLEQLVELLLAVVEIMEARIET